MVGYSVAPSHRVLQSFGLQGEPALLEGGIHGAFRVGDVVLKSESDSRYYSWLCENIFSLEVAGLRLPSPLKTDGGAWLFEGWGAYKFLPGSTLRSDLPQKLHVSRVLHESLKDILHPPEGILDRISYWGVAEHAVWGEIPIPESVGGEVRREIENLVAMSNIVRAKSQIVHLDLAGNILIHDSLDPAVIDMALAYKPVLFAEAVLIHDSLSWYGASLSEVSYWMATGDNEKYSAKAKAFRLLVAALRSLDTKE